jgi:hypothetical protein
MNELHFPGMAQERPACGRYTQVNNNARERRANKFFALIQ